MGTMMMEGLEVGSLMRLDGVDGGVVVVILSITETLDESEAGARSRGEGASVPVLSEDMTGAVAVVSEL